MNAPLRVGLAHNLKRLTPQPGCQLDDEAEYDSETTVNAIASGIESCGHQVALLEADARFPAALAAADVDLVFNIAEGLRGASREAHVPAILELMGVPYTGSDPRCMMLTLDKALAKTVVAAAGVAIPGGVVVKNGDETIPDDWGFPLLVKPVAEGSSKGVLPSSLAWTADEAMDVAWEMSRRYAQGALVEAFLPGREFTVAVLGHRHRVVLPPMEIVFSAGLSFPIYSFDHKLEPNDEVRYEVPAKIPANLDQELRAMALAAFDALGCRDVARIDLRLDAAGRPRFIECNPLPGLTPGWSDLCLISEANGMAYPTLLETILARAVAEARQRDRAAPRVRHAQLHTHD
ncbi:MAG: hypothetical protein KC657_18615 [Myxococcales bacterium]|nr:hypothetical protein [Myxococcales bacterium]